MKESPGLGVDPTWWPASQWIRVELNGKKWIPISTNVLEGDWTIIAYYVDLEQHLSQDNKLTDGYMCERPKHVH